MMDTKRIKEQAPAEVQDGSRSWWTENPMAYDWHGELSAPKFSPEWYDAIDHALIYGSRLFATEQRPFDRIIPFDQIAGKRVLEIGCGMGCHTEAMVRAGAKLTSVDLTSTAVEATRRRLQLKELDSEVIQADAEKLPFGDRSFDFVWSWGVIHHSSRTARVVREIARVLRPEGATRIMVYNREGMSARVSYVKDHVLGGGFLKRTFDETLYRSTDGFSARYYVREQFEDLFRGFFSDVSSEICGQDVDALPLPRQLRRLALRVVPDAYLREAQARRGGFIFVKASCPS